MPRKGRHYDSTNRSNHPGRAPDLVLPTYFESLSIADYLAQKFTNTYPSNEANPNWRGYVRTHCIPGLRWLWKSGDANSRTTLDARVEGGAL